MNTNYADLKRLADARDLVWTSFGGWYNHQADLEEDGCVKFHKDGFSAVYYPNGLVGIYSSNGRQTTDARSQVAAYPNGLGWTAYTGQFKEYVQVMGHDNVLRYYLLPQYKYNYGDSDRKMSALLLHPHPTLNYAPVEPIQDYRITVSRKQKKDALAKWLPFFEYADTIWDMLTIGTPTNPMQPLNMAAGKEVWFEHIQFHKNRGFNGRDLMRGTVENIVMEMDLPYNVELVPNTKTDHTSHWSWDMVARLGEAGKLPK